MLSWSLVTAETEYNIGVPKYMPILQTSKSFTWQGEWGLPMFIHGMSIQDFIQRLKGVLENLCCWERLRFLPL